MALGIEHGEITDYGHGYKSHSVDYDGSFDFEIIRACFLEGESTSQLVLSAAPILHMSEEITEIDLFAHLKFFVMLGFVEISA